MTTPDLQSQTKSGTLTLIAVGVLSWAVRSVAVVLTLYGWYLAFATNIVWGLFALPGAVPFALLGLTEIVLGWHWLSPLWPFSAAAICVGLSLLPGVIMYRNAASA